MCGSRPNAQPLMVAATRQAFLYRQPAREIEKKILEGTYQAGEKLPSIRRLHRQTNLCISTVYQAYMELENTGFVEARPKSGYYVRPVSFNKLDAKKKFRPGLATFFQMSMSYISVLHIFPMGQFNLTY